MYDWRKMTDMQRELAMKQRRHRGFPKHTPPHFDFEDEQQFLVIAACYEHAHIVGISPERMTECEQSIISVCQEIKAEIYAWCVLPNHYHVLLKTDRIEDLRKELGLFHGRSSFKWNGEDDKRGRQVWHNCFERSMKSERHFWASLNYVHNNPVYHGYVTKWQDRTWSSAELFLERIGKDKALEIWKNYPLLDYGKKWDVY